MPDRRTLLSIVRTIVYICLTVALALWHGEVRGYVDAILVDAILVDAIWGDCVTWLVWSLMW